MSGVREIAPRSGVRGHSLLLDRITHRFGGFTAVDDVTVDIAGGELIALLGPSGCGKTTLLRIIAGFIHQSEGSVVVDASAMDHLAPNLRNVGIVFQNYALFPHMNVADNIAYGLAARRWPRAKIQLKVDEMLALVKLDQLRDRLPRELSGGQQQRTAIARAMAVEPKILLLDEPFGALDKNLRLDMQIEVKRIQRELGITSILVTHDQEEALSMADRIAVINQGRLEQLSSPSELYEKPRTLFVNQFVGTTNLIPVRIAQIAASRVTRVSLETGSDLICEADYAGRQDDPAWLSIRPEQLRLDQSATAGNDQAIGGQLAAIMPLGPTVIYEVKTHDGTSIKVTQPRGSVSGLTIGDSVEVKLANPGACAVFPRETGTA
ncbi:MAG: ABC transporter ATP-binding protein [Gammaproteobacteria bacterium]